MLWFHIRGLWGGDPAARMKLVGWGIGDGNGVDDGVGDGVDGVGVVVVVVAGRERLNGLCLDTILLVVKVKDTFGLPCRFPTLRERGSFPALVELCHGHRQRAIGPILQRRLQQPVGVIQRSLDVFSVLQCVCARVLPQALRRVSVVLQDDSIVFVAFVVCHHSSLRVPEEFPLQVDLVEFCTGEEVLRRGGCAALSIAPTRRGGGM